MIEVLESRVLLSTPVDGLLTVNVSGNARIRVTFAPDGWTVRTNGQSEHFGFDVMRILLKGSAGNDRIRLNSNFDQFPGLIALDAGAGDDTLIGGEVGDVLAGGDGDDRIVGKGGGDRLIGGGGKDWLVGGAGDDYFETDDGEHDKISGGAGLDGATFDLGRDDGASIEHGMRS